MIMSEHFICTQQHFIPLKLYDNISKYDKVTLISQQDHLKKLT